MGAVTCSRHVRRLGRRCPGENGHRHRSIPRLATLVQTSPFFDPGTISAFRPRKKGSMSEIGSGSSPHSAAHYPDKVISDRVLQPASSARIRCSARVGCR